MNLLFRLVYAAHASGTHHKLALDALRHLSGPGGERFRRVLLAEVGPYLEGSKAPDKEFKDFTNHVCHVRDGYWGGAPGKAQNWYGHLCEAMRDDDWPRASYCAGVLGHYLSDPVMPFHTGQTEAENTIHRAVEWSVARSYDGLRRVAAGEPTGPDLALGEGPDAIARFVRDSADHANGYYEKLMLHYDFHKGVVDPPAGLDEQSRRFVGALLGFAERGIGLVLERALTETGALPPAVRLSARTFLAGLEIPLRWVTRRIESADERRLIERIYDELQATGTVEVNLPEDDRAVREAYRHDVLAVGAVPGPTKDREPASGSPDLAERQQPASAGNEPRRLQADLRARLADANAFGAFDETEQHGPAETAGSTRTEALVPDHPNPRDDRVRYRLGPDDDVVAAPAIGRKTARRLSAVGVATVGDLLTNDADDLARRLANHHIGPEIVADWQDQARLVCSIPRLDGATARLLVGAGFRDRQSIAHTGTEQLWAALSRFAESSGGLRSLRGIEAPTLGEVEDLVRRAAGRDTDEAA